MVFETTTGLAPQAVIALARDFFATRVPATSAFVEQQSAGHIVLRGQGGEEVVIAAVATAGGAKVRGSSLLFCQGLKRFFSTLPAAGAPALPA